ncbi:MAG: acyl-CoA dehydrogenase family protein [Propionibacteriaceae bacterium]|jgi:butyryl-CoA dehydrogenase|nr:acyl-CoA dehydrogenase family protein [Propionibacteriaceae bacterium]
MFYMTEERQLIVNITREFMEKEAAPVALEHDREGKWPLELFRRAGELGLLGIPFPTEQGGLGADWTTFALVYEEVGKVMPILGIALGSSSILAGGLVSTAGSPEQIEKYMVPANKGELIFAGAFTEATGGANFFEMQGHADPDGDDWIINATKLFITNAGIADVYLVLVRTGELQPGTANGFTFFFVEKDTPGFTVSPPEVKMGFNGNYSATLTFKDVRVPKENVLGKAGDGLKYLVVNSPDEFMAVGALTLGMAEGAYEMALKYSMERMQNGKSLFDNFQVTRFKLANMKLEIEALRGLVYMAFDLRDKGVMPPEYGRMLKIKGPRVAEYVAAEAIQIFGAPGVVFGTGVERFWRDAKINFIAGASLEACQDALANYIRGNYYKSA